MKLMGVFSVAFFRGLTALISFILILLLMHYLSIDSFSSFSFYYTCFTLCSVLPNIGINNSIVLDSENNDFKRKAINVRVYIGLIASFIFLFFLFFQKNDMIFLYACIAGVLSSIFDMQLSFKQATKNIKSYAYFMPLKTGLVFIIALLTIFLAENFVNYFFLNLLIFFGIVFFIWILFFRFTELTNFVENIKIYKLSQHILLFEFLALLMARSEIFILTFYETKNIIGKIDIASFWASYNFILIISMLGTTLSSVILPYMKENVNDYSAINKITNITFSIMLVVILLVVLVSYLIGNYFLIQYSEIYIYILLMGLGVCFSFLSNVDRMKIISGAGSNSKANKIIIFQFLLSVVLNIVFIYIYGVWGAIFTFIFIRAFAWYFMKREVENASKYMG